MSGHVRVVDPRLDRWSLGFMTILSLRRLLPVKPGRSGVQSSSVDETQFEISLIFEGNIISHRVWPSMTILQLMEETGAIYGLDSQDIVLVLFSSLPQSLQRNLTISGPPRVTPGSRVMVFHVPGAYQGSGHHGHHRDHFQPPAHVPNFTPPTLNSKLLSTFKLPKFDGIAKSWKL